MSSSSNETLNDERAGKRMAELEETCRLQCVEIEQLSAELALVKETNQVLSNLHCSLKEREERCARAVAEKEHQRLLEILEVLKSIKNEGSEVENLKNINELMATMHQLTMKFQNLYEKLMATMPQLKMKFNQLCEENRKIPELMAEVDRLGQQLSHGRVLKGDDVPS